MMGYTSGGHGYRVLLQGVKEIVERRDVAFDMTTSDQKGKAVHWGSTSENESMGRRWPSKRQDNPDADAVVLVA